MALNTYGIKMIGLRKTSGATINSSNGYSQISYDKATGELLESWHVGSPMDSWAEYHDHDVIHVCNTSRHMTMQQLADAVHCALTHRPLEAF